MIVNGCEVWYGSSSWVVLKGQDTGKYILEGQNRGDLMHKSALETGRHCASSPTFLFIFIFFKEKQYNSVKKKYINSKKRIKIARNSIDNSSQYEEETETSSIRSIIRTNNSF